MGRLLTIIGEREKVKKDYLKHLEDEYVKQKTEEYYKVYNHIIFFIYKD